MIMSPLCKIGKNAVKIGCVLLLWAFLCILPLRSLVFSQLFPNYFSVPFSEEQKWVFYILGLLPIIVFAGPLYYLHQKYERWYGRQQKQTIEKEIKEFRKKK